MENRAGAKYCNDNGASGSAGAALVARAATAIATVHVRADMADSLVFDTGATHNFVKDLTMLHDKRDTMVKVLVMGGKEVHRVACAGNPFVDFCSLSTPMPRLR